MGMMTFGPGQRLVIPGAQVFAPRVTSVASSGGWWDNNGAISGCVAAYAAKGAADLTASYINLANPGTYNAAPGVAPTFNTADGWTFNGTTQYLVTGITPLSGYAVLVRFSNRANSAYLFGCASTGPTKRFGIYIDTSAIQYDMDTDRAVSVSAYTGGVLAISGDAAYRDGAIETLGASLGTGYPPIAIYIGCRNLNSVANTFANCKIQALAIYSTTLTAGEVATITSAMQAL